MCWSSRSRQRTVSQAPNRARTRRAVGAGSTTCASTPLATSTNRCCCLASRWRRLRRLTKLIVDRARRDPREGLPVVGENPEFSTRSALSAPRKRASKSLSLPTLALSLILAHPVTQVLQVTAEPFPLLEHRRSLADAGWRGCRLLLASPGRIVASLLPGFPCHPPRLWRHQRLCGSRRSAAPGREGLCRPAAGQPAGISTASRLYV